MIVCEFIINHLVIVVMMNVCNHIAFAHDHNGVDAWYNTDALVAAWFDDDDDEDDKEEEDEEEGESEGSDASANTACWRSIADCGIPDDNDDSNDDNNDALPIIHSFIHYPYHMIWLCSFDDMWHGPWAMGHVR